MKKIIFSFLILLFSVSVFGQYVPAYNFNGYVNVKKSIYVYDTVNAQYMLVDSLVGEKVYADTSVAPVGYFTAIYNTTLATNDVYADSIVSTYMVADSIFADYIESDTLSSLYADIDTLFSDSIVGVYIYGDTVVGPVGYFTTIYNTDLITNNVYADSIVTTEIYADTVASPNGYITMLYNTTLATNNIVAGGEFNSTFGDYHLINDSLFATKYVGSYYWDSVGYYLNGITPAFGSPYSMTGYFVTNNDMNMVYGDDEIINIYSNAPTLADTAFAGMHAMRQKGTGNGSTETDLHLNTIHGLDLSYKTFFTGSTRLRRLHIDSTQISFTIRNRGGVEEPAFRIDTNKYIYVYNAVSGTNTDSVVTIQNGILRTISLGGSNITCIDTSNYTVLATDHLISDSTADGVNDTITLPATPTDGDYYEVCKAYGSGTGEVVINAGGVYYSVATADDCMGFTWVACRSRWQKKDL